MVVFFILKYREYAKTAVEVREVKKVNNKEKRVRKFQINWTSWLTYDVCENHMFCEWCRNAELMLN